MTTAIAAPPPATATTGTPVVYGQSVQGLALAAAPDKGRPLRISLMLKNDGVTDVPLKSAFAWLLIVESREKAFFTAQVPLDGQLPAGKEITVIVDLATVKVAEYQKGLKIIAGYPQAQPGQTTLLQELPGKTVKVQAVAYLPAAGEKLTLRSSTCTIAVAQNQSAATTAPADIADLLDLLARFRKDAFAAKAAHEETVKRGPAAVAPLRAAMQDPSIPDFGRMWIATTLIDLGGQEAATAVAELVTDPSSGVRDVVAYHGPRMKDAQVDTAILKRAKEGKDPAFTAWAARGFVEMGRPFPPDLISASVASSEPRARAEIAEVLARSAKPADLTNLAKLCEDENELVRSGAADAIARHRLKNPQILQALVRSLQHPGEAARQHVVESLATVTGNPWSYDPDAPQADKTRTLAAIQQWHEAQPSR
jgi:hypothetical protein